MSKLTPAGAETAAAGLAARAAARAQDSAPNERHRVTRIKVFPH
jgi:hypothetical protein